MRAGLGVHPKISLQALCRVFAKKSALHVVWGGEHSTFAQFCVRPKVAAAICGTLRLGVWSSAHVFEIEKLESSGSPSFLMLMEEWGSECRYYGMGGEEDYAGILFKF